MIILDSLGNQGLKTAGILDPNSLATLSSHVTASKVNKRKLNLKNNSSKKAATLTNSVKLLQNSCQTLVTFSRSGYQTAASVIYIYLHTYIHCKKAAFAEKKLQRQYLITNSQVVIKKFYSREVNIQRLLHEISNFIKIRDTFHAQV
jgi:hypothetical protein